MTNPVSLNELIEFMERRCVGVDQSADAARWKLIHRARAVEPKAECAHVSTFPTNLCAECHKDLGWCYVCGKAPSKHAAEEYTACEAAL